MEPQKLVAVSDRCVYQREAKEQKIGILHALTHPFGLPSLIGEKDIYDALRPRLASFHTLSSAGNAIYEPVHRRQSERYTSAKKAADSSSAI
jgi:hypothetical protein